MAARLSLTVHVRPRSSRGGILGRRADGSLDVALRAAPVGGAANAELVQLLARSLAVPKSAVTIVRGLTTRVKHVQVAGASAAAWSRLAPLAPEPGPVATPVPPPRSRKKP
ncbi:MAG TPA: DUF167 domain-containing protein [Candidatus Udaeobacter sp.]|nr:DUF167 domain-containing protein [Candidatus Udaeobacter sp.]